MNENRQPQHEEKRTRSPPPPVSSPTTQDIDAREANSADKECISRDAKNGPWSLSLARVASRGYHPVPCPDAPVAVVVRRFAFLGHEEAAKFSQIGEVPADRSQGRFVSFCISWTWGSYNFLQIGGKLPADQGKGKCTSPSISWIYDRGGYGFR